MIKSLGIGNGVNYSAIMKDFPLGFRTVPDKNRHNCDELILENRKRLKNRETIVHVFKDFDSEKFYLKVGLEFVQVNLCPWCGEKLC